LIPIKAQRHRACHHQLEFMMEAGLMTDGNIVFLGFTIAIAVAFMAVLCWADMQTRE
jgi:hypothetical protein